MLKSYPVDNVEVHKSGKKDYFNQESVKGELKQDFDKFVANGFKLIHSEPTRSDLIKAVTDNPNPIDGLSTVAVMVVHKLDDISRSQEGEIHDGVKLQSLAIFIHDLMVISRVQLDEAQLKTSFALAVQKYYRGEIDAGRIDPAVLQATAQEAASSMSPEEQAAAVQDLKTVDETARTSQEQVITNAANTPPQPMTAEAPTNG